MSDFLRYRIPIRIRLTLWYVLLMGATFTAIAFYLIARFQNSLRSAVDSSLEATASKTIASFNEDDLRKKSKLTLDHLGQPMEFSSRLAMRLLSPQGEVWDSYGAVQPVPGWGSLEVGLTTQIGVEEEDEWRVLTQPVLDSGGRILAWVQAAQSVQTVTESIQDLRAQLLLGIPLLLLLAGLGGYFLADRALHPIKKIAHTAQEITAQDLSSRLAYIGSLDEIGELAKTFDQMLERLQSSFERERRFIDDAAHELRTPLTVLKGQIEVALNWSRTPAEYEEKLQELLSQVDQLIRLSNALLFLSRSDQNQLSFAPASFNLREPLEVLVEQIRPLANEKSLSINTKMPSEIPVYGDHDHLISLFINMLDNALKYTPIGGQITIEADNGEGGSQVHIHNTGARIPPQHLSHLFERFYRVDADRSSQTGGSGLGLAFAQEIARLHGGQITVKNDTDQGVTFSVRLPAHK